MNIDPTALSVAAALLALCAALLFALRAREAEREAAHERRLRAIADKALELAEREIEALNRERDEARELVASLSGMIPDSKPGDAE